MSCVKCAIPLFLGIRQGRPLYPFLEVLTRAAGHGKEADAGRAPPGSQRWCSRRVTKNSSFTQRRWHNDALDQTPVGKRTRDLWAQRKGTEDAPFPGRGKSAPPLGRLPHPMSHQETHVRTSKQGSPSGVLA